MLVCILKPGEWGLSWTALTSLPLSFTPQNLTPIWERQQCNWSYLHHSKRDLSQCQLSCMVGMLTRMLKNIASSLEARGVGFFGKACLCYTLHPKAHFYPGHGTKIWTSVNQHGRPSTKGVLTLSDLTHSRLRLTPKTQFVWLVWSLCTSLGRGWFSCPWLGWKRWARARFGWARLG